MVALFTKTHDTKYQDKFDTFNAKNSYFDIITIHRPEYTIIVNTLHKEKTLKF